MRNEKYKYYMVRNQRLAGYLMTNGFVLINMSEEITGSGKNVFWFNNSDRLHNYIDKYFQERSVKGERDERYTNDKTAYFRYS